MSLIPDKAIRDMIFQQFYLESLTVSIDSNLERLYLKQVLE